MNVGFVEQLQERGLDRKVCVCAKAINGSVSANTPVGQAGSDCLQKFRLFFSSPDVQTTLKSLENTSYSDEYYKCRSRKVTVSCDWSLT